MDWISDSLPLPKQRQPRPLQRPRPAPLELHEHPFKSHWTSWFRPTPTRSAKRSRPPPTDLLDAIAQFDDVGAYLMDSLVPAPLSLRNEILASASAAASQLDVLIRVAVDSLSSPSDLELSRVTEHRENLLKIMRSVVVVEMSTRLLSAKFELDELRDLAYDVEDLLDLYKYELLAAKAREPVPPSSVVAASLVQITGRMGQMRERVKNASVSGLLLKNVSVVKKGRYGIGGTMVSLQPAEKEGCVAATRTNGVFVGREDDVERLVELLVKDDDKFLDGSSGDACCCVIAVVGGSGIGKTTLVQRVYNDLRVRRCFHLQGWVCGSSVDFDESRSLARAAVKALMSNSCSLDKLEMDDIQVELLEDLKRVVDRKKFLLVVDDLQPSGWGDLENALRDGARGSKVVIITTSQRIADDIHVSECLQLGCLSDKDSWQLFQSHAFNGSNSEQNLVKEIIGLNIARKCKGLPLTIKVIANLLRYEDDNARWKNVLESEIWKLQHAGGEEILSPLQLSYLYLPAYLKPCFAYCSIFPKVHKISKKKLIHLWIAHDFIQGRKGKILEEIGMEYIDELLSRSFLQPNLSLSIFSKGNEPQVSLHELIYDLAQCISGAECYVAQYKHYYPSHVARHVTFSSPQGVMQLLLPSSKPSNTSMRTILVLDSLYQTVFKDIVSFDNFKSLRVLDLGTNSMNEFPESICNLKLLRYLRVRHSNIKILHASICTLYNLQGLDLGWTCIKDLHISIGNLKCLRHLNLKGTKVKNFPASICLLGNLRSLDLRKTHIKELPKSLCNLGQLQLLNLKGTLIRKLPESVCSLDNLKNLDLGKTLIKELPCSVGSLKRLHFLNLEDTAIRKLPESVCKLSELKTLGLRNCQELEGLPAGIGRLTLLQELGCFPVGNNIEYAGISELGSLLSLRDSLSITNLCNVVSAEEVRIANLMTKVNLEKLVLSWKVESGTSVVVQEELEERVAEREKDVLESLKPNASLKELEIVNYMGFDFPKWVGDQSLTNLVSLKLYSCQMCEALPPLEKLPSLMFFHIEWMPSLGEVDLTGKPIPSLKQMQIRDCPNLVKVNTCVVDMLEIDGCENLEILIFRGTSITHLKITDCPKLRFSLDMRLLPHVGTLEIYECPLVISWCHRHKDIELACVDKIMVDGLLQDRDKRF